MEQRASAVSLSLQQRVRSLGFDPEHLTPEEQVELLSLHATMPPVNPLDGNTRSDHSGAPRRRTRGVLEQERGR